MAKYVSSFLVTRKDADLLFTYIMATRDKQQAYTFVSAVHLLCIELVEPWLLLKLTFLNRYIDILSLYNNLLFV